MKHNLKTGIENKYFNKKYRNYANTWRKAHLNFAWFVGKLNINWKKKWPKEVNKLIWKGLYLINLLLSLILWFCQIYVDLKWNFLKTAAELEYTLLNKLT